MSISVVINTWNEEKNIARAIGSVAGLADEVVVVDMYSSDETTEIARKAGAKIFQHAYVNYVEPARNFAIDKARGEWILILDADETLSPFLVKTLKQAATKNTDYFRLPRKNIIFGKWQKHSGWWPDYQVRFFRKGQVTWNPEIHSVPITRGKGEDLPADENHALIHFHYRTIYEYIERLNRYTSQQAREKPPAAFCELRVLEIPEHEIFSRFYAWEGYRDGYHGMNLALLQGFSGLVTGLKLWEAAGFPEGDAAAALAAFNQMMQRLKRNYKYWYFLTLANKNRGIISLFYKLRAKWRI